MYISNRHKKDIAYTIVLFVILITILYLFYLYSSPKEASAHFRTVILIDCSDNLSKRQKKSIMNDISTIKDRVLKNNTSKRELIFFTIKGDAPTIPSPVASIIIDGRGMMSDKRWQYKNLKKIEGLFINIENILSHSDDSTQTPMFEYLKNISSSALKNNHIEPADYNELIIYSDFVQIIDNKWPIGNNRLNFNEYKKTKYYEETKIHLKGVEIKMRYIEREKYRKIQTDEHREFWKSYFQDAGVKNIDFVSIY